MKVLNMAYGESESVRPTKFDRRTVIILDNLQRQNTTAPLTCGAVI
jgi:hypothetical protein